MVKDSFLAFSAGLAAVLAVIGLLGGGTEAWGQTPTSININYSGTNGSACGTNCIYMTDNISGTFILRSGTFEITSDGSIVTNKSIQIDSAQTVTLTIEDLNLKSAHNRSPIAIAGPPSAGDNVTTLNLTIKGENSLVAGSSAPGIAVPQFANLTISGDGKATITGGNRSNNAAGSAAGIGGSGYGTTDYGLKIYNYNATATSRGLASRSTNPRYNNCGNVTLNGGRLTIGADGSTGTTSTLGLGAGIGGGGGYNSNGGIGCTLIINGGTHIVSGAHTDNAIGKGSATSTTYGNDITDGTLVINGGSLYTTGANGNGGNGIRPTPYRSSSATNSPQVYRREFTIGANNIAETKNKLVSSCEFGTDGAIKCNQSLTAYESSQYGINSVFTNSTGKVYFWLINNYNIQSSASMTLDFGNNITKFYNPSATPGTNNNAVIFQGPLPSMTVPVGQRNVDDGAYLTGYPAPGVDDYYAAVNHEITLKKGSYIANDANLTEANGSNLDKDTRVHLVRWYRSDNGSSGWTEISKNSRGFLSSIIETAKYKPGPNDYGKYIRAEVLVRDNGTRPANFSEAQGDVTITDETWENWKTQKNVVEYPAIRVGVVVEGITDKGAGIGNSGTIDIKQGGSIGKKGLITNITEILNLTVSGVRDAASAPTSNIKHDWNFSVNSSTNSKNGFMVNGKDISGDNKSESCDDEGFCTGSEFFFKLPQACSTSSSSDCGVSGDIILTDMVKDATTPKLINIKICKEINTDDNIGCTDDNYIDANVSGQNEFNINTPIPKTGNIILTFDSKIENFKDGGDVTLLLGDGTKAGIIKGNRYTDNTIVYEYGLIVHGDTLIPGGLYNLNVKNFMNLVNPIISVQANLTIERRAYISGLEYYFNTEQDTLYQFLVGETRRTKIHKYDSSQSGPQTELCFYWEKSGSNFKNKEFSNPSSDDSIPYVNDTKLEFNKMYCKASSFDAILKSPELTVDEFGYYIRLAVRPKGTYPIDGSVFGEAIFLEEKRVGVLLQPGYPTEAGTDSTYREMIFGSCVVDYNKSNSNIPGCYDNGYVIYEKNDFIDLIVTTRNLYGVSYKVNGWDYKVNGVGHCPTETREFNITGVSRYAFKIGTPCGGKYTLTPKVGEIAPPVVVNLSIKDINNSEISLKNLKEPVTTAAIENNALSLTFDPAADGNYGTILLYGNDTTTICTGTNCKAADNKFLLDDSQKGFNKAYKIVVFDFKSATGDQMAPDAFYFTTGPGPGLGEPELESTAGPAPYTISFKGNTEPAYFPNAGSDKKIIKYCWETSSKLIGSAPNCVGDVKDLEEFNTNIKILNVAANTYVRLVLVAIDTKDRYGDYIGSAWMYNAEVIKIIPNEVIFTFKSASIGERDYDVSDVFSYDQLKTAFSSILAHDTTLFHKEIIGGEEKIVEDKICLNLEKALFILDSSTVGNRTVKNVMGSALVFCSDTSDVSGFYTLKSTDGYENLTAKINKMSLASLKDTTDTDNYYYKGEYSDKCKAVAKATYGENLLTGNWETSLDYLSTNCKVKKGYILVGGNWRLCNKDGTTTCEDVTELSDNDYIKIPNSFNHVYAFFEPTDTTNYKSDLFVRIFFEVNKRTINIKANLANVGDKGRGYGIKTYDGLSTIEGYENAIPEVTGLVKGDNTEGITATDARFITSSGEDSPEVGRNKILQITWGLTGIANDKYTVNTGVPETGTILQRLVNITGLKAKNKYYNGELNVDVSEVELLKLQTKKQAIAACEDRKSCKDSAEYIGVIDEHTVDGVTDTTKLHFIQKGDAKFEFVNRNAGENKTVTLDKTAYELNKTQKSNYELHIGGLEADIYQQTLAHYWCKKLNAPAAECSDNDRSITEKWLMDSVKHIGSMPIPYWNEVNVKNVLKHLIYAATNDSNKYATATYGELFGSISGRLSDVLPSELKKVLSSDTTDPTNGSWTWDETSYVPDVDTTNALKYITATYRHSNSNYAFATIPVPLMVSPRQLLLTNVYADSVTYKVCHFFGDCGTDNEAREVKLKYTLSGVVNNEISESSALNVIGLLDNPNAGEREVASIESIAWALPIPARAGNYLLPSGNGVSIPFVTVWPAAYPGVVPDPVTSLPLLHGHSNAFIYDRDKYPILSMIGFDSLNSLGWSWTEMGKPIDEPSGGSAEYVTRWYQAQYMPPLGVCTIPGLACTAPGDIYINSGNFRPYPDSVALRIYKRSEDSGLDFARVESPCGADTARVTVAARNEYATVWFDNTQYSESDSRPSRGTFPVSGLEYGGNDIPYRINAQAYNFGSEGVVHHIRNLPFGSVAKWIRAKSLTVSLDSSLLAERTFFRKHEFDLSRTRWFRGKDSVGTGVILSVSSGTGDYSLVLFGKNGRDAFASCKESGAVPELPPHLEWVPVSNVPKLPATSFGSRLAAGGTSLTFNTPNGGTVSIYTMKGELVGKMLAVDDRTVVKLPATRGIYIVKLEAKK